MKAPRTCRACGAILDAALARSRGVRHDPNHTDARCRARQVRLAVRSGPTGVLRAASLALVLMGCAAPTALPRPVAPTPTYAHLCDGVDGPHTRRNRSVVVSPGVTVACY